MGEDAYVIRFSDGAYLTSNLYYGSRVVQQRYATMCDLMEVHDTRKSALAATRVMLRKGWGDYFAVRRVDFGPPTILEDR